MKTREEFRKIISYDFWDHIHRKSYVPLAKKGVDRVAFCDNLYDAIGNHTYHPRQPRQYIIANKHNGVTRVIPVFSREDNCVYYYCVKCLEEYLAKRYVDCTFGGYKMGGAMREMENRDENAINEMPDYAAEFSYNPLAWAKAWKDFQLKAYQISRDENLGFFICFDIANFYNSINLTLLESKIRNCADQAFADEIDLLIYFLKYWNRKLSFYAPCTVGLPMDDFGDSSRLLANFFLQEYDRKIYSVANELGAKYLRFSDDQIILAPDKLIAEKIFHCASLELNKIGLNINSGKVKRFACRKEFEAYWAFGIFHLLSDSQDRQNIEKAITLYLQEDRNYIRWQSVLKRLISCDLKQINIHLKAKIFAQLYDPDFLEECDYRQLKRLYDFLGNDTEKQIYINNMYEIVDKTLFNKFPFELLLAKQAGLPVDATDRVFEKIKELNLM